ncbi:MAG: OsmC family protein [Flavobacteriales bacterium]|nr:OsmC family protein [Flavobacteriales bacterium]
MATIHTTYPGDLRTKAIHVQSGEAIITDAPVDNEGRGEAFSPTDLLAASLGSCMITIMGIRSRKRNITIDGCRAEITKIMASDPRRVSEVHVELYFPDVDYTPEDKKILEDAAMNCPVAKSLHPDIIQRINFHYSK